MAAKNSIITRALSDCRVVIVADGAFPQHPVPLAALAEAEFIVCCDGATASLIEYGLTPVVIIGDLDSLDPTLAARFSDRLVRESDQQSNDLTKAVRWCSSHGAESVTIVGATGKREDHTLGNISLLADYGKMLKVIMLTDTGVLSPVYESCYIATKPGQRFSVFSLDSDVRLTATGLRYPVNDLLLGSWWTATLNTATGNRVKLTLTPSRLITYLGHL